MWVVSCVAPPGLLHQDVQRGGSTRKQRGSQQSSGREGSHQAIPIGAGPGQAMLQVTALPPQLRLGARQTMVQVMGLQPQPPHEPSQALVQVASPLPQMHHGVSQAFVQVACLQTQPLLGAGQAMAPIVGSPPLPQRQAKRPRHARRTKKNKKKKRQNTRRKRTKRSSHSSTPSHVPTVAPTSPPRSTPKSVGATTPGGQTTSSGQSLPPGQSELDTSDPAAPTSPSHFAGRSEAPDLESLFEKSKDVPRQHHGDFGVSWPAADECDAQLVATVRAQIQAFLRMDFENGEVAVDNWPRLLRAAYPPQGPQWRGAGCQPLALPRGKDLEEMLLVLVMRTYRNRAMPGGQCRRVSSIEYFSGLAALTRAHLARGLQASRFDKVHGEHHDCLTPLGLAGWLDENAFTVEHALEWLGTQCSSWVVVCRCQSQRTSANGFWGNTGREFVRKGNEQMIITSLIFLVACLRQNLPVLEQPLNSVMPRARPLLTVFQFVGASKTVTYLASFGGETVKPLQLWHVGPAYGALRRAYPIRFKAKFALVNRRGKRFSGKKGILKASQAYPPAFGAAVAAITDRVQRGHTP